MNVAVLGIKTIPAVAGADRVVEQLLENFSPNNERRPIDYVPNGVKVEPDDGNGDPLLTSLRLQPRSFILFACGRLDPTKGLHHLLDAYERANPDERLLILGDFAHDPDYSREIERRIAARYGNSPERVCVVRDLLPRARLLRVLRACKLFVFPSEYEAMSMMLLEAVSSRAPIVCSDFPENLAVLGDDYPFAYAANDAGALAATIQRALSDRDWARRTDELHARCVREFSWSAVARRYEEIYDELAGARRKAAGVRAPSTSS